MMEEPQFEPSSNMNLFKNKLLAVEHELPNGIHSNGVIDRGTARVYSRKRGRESTPEATPAPAPTTTTNKRPAKRSAMTAEQRIDGLLGKTADGLLALAGLRKLSGGGVASSLETTLVTDAQHNLETLVSRVAPGGLFDKTSLTDVLENLNFKMTADNKIQPAPRPVEVERPKLESEEVYHTETANFGLLSFEEEADAELRQVVDDYDDLGDDQSLYLRHKQLSKYVQQLKAEAYIPQPVPAVSSVYMNTMGPCAVCQLMVKEMHNVLVCDGCERIHHQKCLPNVRLLPKNDWYCTKCVIEGGGKAQPHKYGSVRKGVTVPPASKGQVRPQPETLPQSMVASQQFSPGFDHTKVEKTPVLDEDSRSGSGPSDSGRDDGLNGLSEFDRPPRTAGTRVEWIGDPHIMTGRAFYKSFSVGGITFRIKDCAMFNPEGDAPPYIARIQNAWQDIDSNKNYVRVNWCYYPNDNQLPAVDTLPETSEIDEVYESNHCDDNLAESIQGPCLVLNPQKYAEEKQKRSKLLDNGFDGELPPLFICKWFFDTGKSMFRKMGED